MSGDERVSRARERPPSAKNQNQLGKSRPRECEKAKLNFIRIFRYFCTVYPRTLSLCYRYIINFSPRTRIWAVLFYSRCPRNTCCGRITTAVTLHVEPVESRLMLRCLLSLCIISAGALADQHADSCDPSLCNFAPRTANGETFLLFIQRNFQWLIVDRSEYKRRWFTTKYGQFFRRASLRNLHEYASGDCSWSYYRIRHNECDLPLVITYRMFSRIDRAKLTGQVDVNSTNALNVAIGKCKYKGNRKSGKLTGARIN